MWHQHGSVDALAGEGVDMAGCVAHNQQVVVKGGREALGAKPQCCGAHPFDLGLGSQCTADEGVVLDGALVQPLQVLLLQPEPTVNRLSRGFRVSLVWNPRTRSRNYPLRCQAALLLWYLIVLNMHLFVLNMHLQPQTATRGITLSLCCNVVTGMQEQEGY